MFRRDQLSIATGYFAHGLTSDEVVLEMVADPPGYIWSFPRPDHLAIGVCAQADAGAGVNHLRRLVWSWMRATGIAAGARLEPYAWPIPSLSAGDFMSVPVAGPGWLTVGDAAGLVDPITREGIYFALRSAGVAADAVSAGGAHSSRVFTGQVREEIGSELARAARYKAGFFRPQFARLLMTALQASQPVREVMADLVAGTQSYRALKWRLAGTLESGLAWQLARSGWQRG
jgi:flavin-dependent dehydrogenase